MDDLHSNEIEAAVSLENTAPSNEEITSGKIEAAASLEDGHPSAEESTQENSLVSSMRENALPLKKDITDGPTIFHVPCIFLKNKEHLIEPSVVSVGPYHRGREHLALTEDIKWSLLQNILSLPNVRVTLEACVGRLKGLSSQARSCYSGRVDMDDDSFVEMLILDATFIIEFLRKPDDWFMRETGCAYEFIKTNLILLENQIPFFVVHNLWELYFPGVPLINPIYLEIIGRTLCPDLILGNTTVPQDGIHHLLHLYHHFVVPNMSTHVTVFAGCSCFDLCKTASSNNEVPDTVPCATELKNAGIKFRKKKSPCNMMAVTFQGGTLEIPFINATDNIKPLIINLLASKQSRVISVPRHLTSNVCFMDSLINTEDDVAILQQHGIIENHLSGEEEVALFFNQLGEGVVRMSGHYLSDLINYGGESVL